MIPKIIHFVWLGNNEKPDYVLRCMESWKKYCPDYSIMEWGNDSLKDISFPYVHQAVENRKWAFASDVIRLKALYEYGGIYVDTDVEITNNIDKFLEYEFVSGYENFHSFISPITTAFMGAVKGNSIIKDLLSEYEELTFEKNGKLDLTPNTKRVTIYFENKYGLQKPYDGNSTTFLEEKMVLFPATHFCVMEKGKENYSIHHFEGSWLDPYNRHEIFSLGKYRIVRFKRREKIPEGPLPLKNTEKMVYCKQISRKRFIAILKYDNK